MDIYYTEHTIRDRLTVWFHHERVGKRVRGVFDETLELTPSREVSIKGQISARRRHTRPSAGSPC